VRTIITPATQRASQSIAITPEQKKQWEERQARLQADIIGRREKIEEALARAFEPLDIDTQRDIRLRVALTAPNKPMSAQELQDWLDERCIGIARYYWTGSVT
jgi:hypothetical protein